MADALVWTECASAEIEAIVRYADRRNPEAAAETGRGICERAQILLAANPEPGTILKELRQGGRRKIVYTFRSGTIIVGRVWPAALGEADLGHRVHGKGQ